MSFRSFFRSDAGLIGSKRWRGRQGGGLDIHLEGICNLIAIVGRRSAVDAFVCLLTLLKRRGRGHGSAPGWSPGAGDSGARNDSGGDMVKSILYFSLGHFNGGAVIYIVTNHRLDFRGRTRQHNTGWMGDNWQHWTRFWFLFLAIFDHFLAIFDHFWPFFDHFFH